MAYSRDLAVMDYHGLSWMTFVDDFHGLVMDDWTLLFLSYFYILISYGLTDRQDRLTLVLVKLLLQLKYF